MCLLLLLSLMQTAILGLSNGWNEQKEDTNMAFEAEVIPLFIIGASIVCILELVCGWVMLKQHRQARKLLIGHTVCMAIAMMFLICCLFASQLGMDLGIASISNSASVGLFGIFWLISVCLLLAAVSTIAGNQETEK